MLFCLYTGYMEVIICVGGEDDKVVLRSVEMFDPDTCRWKPLSCLPFAISKHGMVSSGKYRNDLFLDKQCRPKRGAV